MNDHRYRHKKLHYLFAFFIKPYGKEGVKHLRQKTNYAENSFSGLCPLNRIGKLCTAKETQATTTATTASRSKA